MVAVLEELINSLYDMIQEARSVPLSADKCMIDQEKALDILEDYKEKTYQRYMRLDLA